MPRFIFCIHTYTPSLFTTHSTPHTHTHTHTHTQNPPSFKPKSSRNTSPPRQKKPNWPPSLSTHTSSSSKKTMIDASPTRILPHTQAPRLYTHSQTDAPRRAIRWVIVFDLCLDIPFFLCIPSFPITLSYTHTYTHTYTYRFPTLMAFLCQLFDC